MRIGRCDHRMGGRQRAFTLLEVMLTLTLLVVLSALAWPALEKPFASIRLHKAAETIRGAWVDTRVKAIDSGEVYVFRCLLEEGQYTIEEYFSATGGVHTEMGREVTVETGALGTNSLATEDNLPTNIVFVFSEATLDTRSMMITVGLEETEMRESGWSDPIPFYPDGTTADARIVLANEYGQGIEVALRGLTGSVTISDVFSAEDYVQ